MSGKPYMREVPTTTWWLQKRSYTLHMVQEFSCIVIGIYSLILLWGCYALSEGPEAYQAFLEALASPLSLVFHWVAVVFLFWHALTWFSLTPKAMPLMVGDDFLPGWIIVAAHYGAWAVLSLVILWLSGVI